MTDEINELQENLVADILSLFYDDKESIGIKAPTGSGKTYMMAMFMDKLLSQSDKYIFIVSSLSKGDLAEQCYNSFVKNSDYKFTNLRPYLISTGNENSKNTEYSIQIDWGYNVYVLPTNQLTSASRINKECAFLSFLIKCKDENKDIVLIKDESHITTNNLNSFKDYFKQTINFSATPKNDKYDLILTESEAVKAKLIKSVKYIDNKDDELEVGLAKALKTFKDEIRPTYEDYDIVPAFIVQISNSEQGQEQFEKIVNVVEEQGLQWVSFVDNDKKYETNNAITKNKNRKIWRELIKQPNYPIDVIIFKMVITEGFDIPRACVLYQIRDTQSVTLDEQVVGRVRRNPYLINFDRLNKDTQEHFSKAYVYGVKPNDTASMGKKEVKLRGDNILHLSNQIIKEFSPFKSVMLKEVAMSDIDIAGCIERSLADNKDIFKAYKELNQCDSAVRKKRREFVTHSSKWFDFTSNLDKIKEEVRSVVEDYDKYGNMLEIADGLRSNIYAFMDLNGNKFNCDSCVWTDSKDDELHHDSIAELEWFKILNRLKTKCCKSIKINSSDIYLFGKNYVDNYSNVKFDYYYKTKHTSYPDFIFKDKKDTIHIFEVKSVNGNSNTQFDTDRYKEKVEKLKKAYLFASNITGYVFYIPIYSGDDWQIWSCENGVEKDLMNKAIFENYMQNRN
ncbi:DEAD/DEAH box helicase family protein [Campylobacter sp. faydin G-24]|uniref:DEAD/DEAH box helicase family protein n=1 Tax=Campylobacter anatolicus TaxID=2829105 RepID=A0ABS5HID0_9BACT|nr:DEAD/DEAH box helicase family protein [Campylobacter anatolicus]MBR8464035.1 DEAD/DEAH box helicase family protein [Campylobacter anatolicus]